MSKTPPSGGWTLIVPVRLPDRLIWLTSRCSPSRLSRPVPLATYMRLSDPASRDELLQPKVPVRVGFRVGRSPRFNALQGVARGSVLLKT